MFLFLSGKCSKNKLRAWMSEEGDAEEVCLLEGSWLLLLAGENLGLKAVWLQECSYGSIFQLSKWSRSQILFLGLSIRPSCSIMLDKSFFIIRFFRTLFFLLFRSSKLYGPLKIKPMIWKEFMFLAILEFWVFFIFLN